MRKNRLIVLVLLVIECLTAYSQTQQGYVKTLGRPDKKGAPLSGVSVRVKGEHNPVLSKDNGTFSMLMAGKRNGDAYSLQEVQKKGYELNERGVIGRQYAYSDKVPLTIVMVSSVQLQADKQRIENNAFKVAEKNYKAKLELLEKQKAESVITEERYRKELLDLQDKFEKYQLLIDGLAEHYAHVDYDELDEKEREVNSSIENGELERADSLIKTLFDPIDALKRNKEALAQLNQQISEANTIMEKANEDMAAVLRQQEKDANYLYQLYTIALSRFDNDKALFYITTRAELDTTNVKWQYDASNFLTDNRADYTEALKYAERCLTIEELQSNDDSLRMVKYLNQIGTILYYEGEYEKARQYHVRAQKILDAYPSVLSEDVVDTYLCFGNLYDALPRTTSISGIDNYAVASRELAKEAFENALKTCEKLPHVSPYYLGGCYYNLGYILEKEMFFSKAKNDVTSYLDKNKKARMYFEKAIEEWNKDEIVHAGYIATARMQMAMTALNDTDMLKQHSEALELLEKVYGDLHPNIATCLMNIADAYGKKDDLANSYAFYQKAYDIRKKIFGEKHASTLFCKRRLERIKEIELVKLPLKYNPGNIIEEYWKTKDYDKTLKNIVKSKEMLEEYADSIWILPMELYENWGIVSNDQKKYADAVEAYSTAVWIKGQTNPEKDDVEFQRLSKKFIEVCNNAKDYHTKLLFLYNLVQADFINTEEAINDIIEQSEEYLKYNPDDTEVIKQYKIVKEKYAR